MGKVSESIWDGGATIPLADVQHIENRGEGCCVVVMKSSTWNTEIDDYNNGIFLNAEGTVAFKAAWCRYRSELEASTLMDLSPKETNKEEEQEQTKNNYWYANFLEKAKDVPSVTLFHSVPTASFTPGDFQRALNISVARSFELAAALADTSNEPPATFIKAVGQVDEQERVGEKVTPNKNDDYSGNRELLKQKGLEAPELTMFMGIPLEKLSRGELTYALRIMYAVDRSLRLRDVIHKKPSPPVAQATPSAYR